MSAESRFDNYMSGFLSKKPNKVVKEIAQGKAFPTLAVMQLDVKDSVQDNQYRNRLEKAGIIEALLDLIDKCSSHSFEKAKKSGDLAHLLPWIDALDTMVEPRPGGDGGSALGQQEEACLLVARRIGPLAECMANPKRELFGKREYWLDCVIVYGRLLFNLTSSSEAIPLLIEQQAVVDYVVQALFWSQYRPAIMEELYQHQTSTEVDLDRPLSMKELCIVHRPSFDKHTSQVLFAGVIRVLFLPIISDGPLGQLNDAQKRIASRLANTAAVCSGYTGLCSSPNQITFSSASLELLLVNGEGGPNMDELLFPILRVLSAEGFLGNGAIVDLVEISDKTKSDEAASYILSTLTFALTSPTDAAGFDRSRVADDKRFALAIGAGLFESLLQLQVFISDEDADLGTLSIGLLHLAGQVALSRRTSKAIQARASLIREKVEGVKQLQLPSLPRMIEIIEELLVKASSLQQSGVDVFHCGWCDEALGSNEKRRCAGCKRAVYCSRECQVRAWKDGGHELECKMLAEADRKAEASGATKKERKSMNRTRENCVLAAERCVHQHRNEILEQVAENNLDISDCVIVVDLDQIPPGVDALCRSVLLGLVDKHNVQVSEYAASLMEENRLNGDLTVACKKTLTVGPNKGNYSVDVMTMKADEWYGQRGQREGLWPQASVEDEEDE